MLCTNPLRWLHIELNFSVMT